MGKYSEGFVAFDTAKLKHAVAIADGGRQGEIRFLGEIANQPATIERLIRKLAGRYSKLQVCFEAGPTGYGLYRQIRGLGHECMVVAPALVPRRSGERVKTNRRDAMTLARLFRAGELPGVWVPDSVHEAVRDLVRGRMAAADDLRRKRQQLLSFLLRHGRRVEAAHVADLGGKGHRDQERDAAHRLIGGDHRRHRPARHEGCELVLEPAHSLDGILDRSHPVLEDDLLRRMLEALGGQPAAMRTRPVIPAREDRRGS